MRLILSTLCLCVLSACTSTIHGSSDQTSGVLFAYSGPSLVLPSDHACTVLRQGKITEQRGPKTLPTVGRFALLRCSGGVNGLLKSLTKLASHGAESAPSFLARGEFNRLEENRALPEQAVGRGYVVKLSYSNGETRLAERELHEDGIDELARERASGWRREARIYVRQAVGIDQPDAVGVLYFRSPADRSRFRQEETDIVGEISNFNRRHLQTYVYLYGQKD